MEVKMLARVGLLSLGLSISSCTAVSQSTPVIERISPTAAPLASSTHEPTLLPTSQPSHSFTPTINVLDQEIAVSTLSSSEALKIANILDQAGSCVLPCWNGLTPGISQIDDLPEFFSRLGYAIQDEIPYDSGDGGFSIGGRIMGYPIPPAKTPPVVNVFWRDSTVEAIYFSWGWVPDSYDLGSIKTTLGYPDEIFDVIEGQGRAFYQIILDFKDNHTGIILSGKATTNQVEDDYWSSEVCLIPEEDPSLLIVLYSEGIDLTDLLYYEPPLFNWNMELGIQESELFDRLSKGVCVPQEEE
jgi:hypothetical protein